MSDDDLVEGRRLLQAATPAPWTPSVESERGWKGEDYGRWYLPTFGEAPFDNLCAGEGVEDRAKTDAALLCWLRNHGQSLLDGFGCRLISVHQDLPPLGQEVLVLLHDGRYDVAYRFEKWGLWRARERTYEGHEITDWMTLPKKESK